MFATTTVRKLLFNGYTEPSVLKYLNLKLEKSSIRFECREQPYDICGEQLFDCITPGLVLILPHNRRYPLLLSFNVPYVHDLYSYDCAWPPVHLTSPFIHPYIYPYIHPSGMCSSTR